MRAYAIALIVWSMFVCNVPANAQDYTISEFLNGYDYGDKKLKRLVEGDVAQMGHAFVSVNGFLMTQKKNCCIANLMQRLSPVLNILK